MKLLAVMSFAALVACSPADKSAGNATGANMESRQYNAAAEQFTAQLLLPGFDSHAIAARELAAAAERYCGGSAADETALQAAWATAFISWQKTNFLLFGPLTEERALRMQFTPDKRQLVPARVQQLLRRLSSISADKIAAGTAPTQGYPAVQQLIFTIPAADANRCKLLAAIAAFVAMQAEQLSVDWQQQAEAFAADGEEAVGRVVDSLQRAVNRLNERQLAEPFGPANLATVESLQRWLTGPYGLKTLANNDEERLYFNELKTMLVAVTGQPENSLVSLSDSLRQLKKQVSQLNTVLQVYTGFNADDGD